VQGEALQAPSDFFDGVKHHQKKLKAIKLNHSQKIDWNLTIGLNFADIIIKQ